MKINLTTRARLIIAFFVVALIPMGLLAYLNGRTTRQALIDNANQALFAVASQTAASLDTFINTNIESIETEAQLPALTEFLSLSSSERRGSTQENEVITLLTTLSSIDANIVSYALLDNRGRNTIDTISSDINTDESDREYFTIFQTSNIPSSYVSPVQFFGDQDSPFIHFSSPVFNASGSKIGVLRVRYDAAILQALLEEKNDIAGNGSFGVLFDEHHIHLAHGVQPDVNFIPITRFEPDRLAALKSFNRLPNLPDDELFPIQLDELDDHLSNPETQRFFEAEDVATGELINQVAIAEMESQPWLVAFFQPQEIFLAPVVAQTSNTALLVVIFSILAVILAFFVSQILGKPIIQLTETVSQFTDGNLDARSEINSSDEIGILSSSFNAMASQVSNLLTGLENRKTELETEVLVREQAENALRKSEERYRRISELASDYVYSVIVKPDQSLDLEWSTEAFSRFTGYSPDQLAAKGGWPGLVHPDDREQFIHARNFVLASGEPDEVEYRIVTKNGEVRWLRDFRRPLWDEKRTRVIRLLGAAQDITAHKAADAELNQAKEDAESASVAKSAFLANMSHELRTPLNAVLGFTQLMMRDRELSSGHKEHIRIINRSGEHLLTLINDILEMSKIEAGRTSLNENSLDLYRLLDDIEDMLQLRAKDEELLLLFERTPNVPQHIRLDESKLRQVMINLVSNAIKFTQEGGVSVRVDYRKDGEADRLYFEVEDSGPGIVEDEIEFLFDAFVQTKSGKMLQEGTGLGLSISQQYVKLMGGEITVSSRLDQGSIFKFDVLFTIAEASDVPTIKPARDVIGLEPDQPTYRILIVEDREENRTLLVNLLKPLGFDIREAVNGQEAIEVWKSWEPHLIWMDMRMPVMDGYEATKQIKATANGPQTVIIALTASAFEENRAMSLEAGAYDFVRKPFRNEEIFERLAQHLGARFIYADEDDSDQVSPPHTKPLHLDPTELSSIPDALLKDLHLAATQADAERIHTIILKIRDLDVALADILTNWVANFRFDNILALTQENANGEKLLL